MKTNSLDMIYKSFLSGGEVSYTDLKNNKASFGLKDPRSYFFIFETCKNYFGHNADSNPTLEELTDVKTILVSLNDSVRKLLYFSNFQKNKGRKGYTATYNAISRHSNTILNIFRTHFRHVYLDRNCLEKIVDQVLYAESSEYILKDIGLFRFYGHLFTKHSLYGAVYWMHCNPGKELNWKRFCREFIILNEIDPSKEDVILENFSSAFRCLLKETTINVWTNSLLDANEHYFTSDLNARMLELLAVEQSGLEK